MAGDRNEPESLRLGSTFGRYRLDALLGREGWASSSAPRMCPSSVRSRSRSCRPSSPPSPRSGLASSANPVWPQPSSTPRSCQSTTPGRSGTPSTSRCGSCPGETSGRSFGSTRHSTLDRTLALIASWRCTRRRASSRPRSSGHQARQRARRGSEDGPGAPILVDFGLTHRLGDLSATGHAPVGTIDYVAPEQSPEGRPSDGRTDQYGLACVVVHCLTGAPPFAATPTRRCCRAPSREHRRLSRRSMDAALTGAWMQAHRAGDGQVTRGAVPDCRRSSPPLPVSPARVPRTSSAAASYREPKPDASSQTPPRRRDVARSLQASR